MSIIYNLISVVFKVVSAVWTFLQSLFKSGAVGNVDEVRGSIKAKSGLDVVLHSLTVAELNGLTGTIASSAPNAKNRWDVNVNKKGGEVKLVALKLSNLVWKGRHVQLGGAEEAIEFSGGSGVISSESPEQDGRWLVEARKLMNLKPANLELFPTTADGTFQRGSCIKVHGLQAAPIYNGLIGYITSTSLSSQGRWEVEVTKDIPQKVEQLTFDMPWAASIFGEKLQTKHGLVNTQDLIANKRAVLVYFSAHWCPPCKNFTPILAEAYKKCANKEVEVIFVSSDRDNGSFESYFGEMPWCALPFADRTRQGALSSKFGVQGIPMLVVLRGSDGSVASANARAEVQTMGDLTKSLPMWVC